MSRSALYLGSALVGLLCQVAHAQTSSFSLLAYTVPAGFPTSLFPAYYIPASPTQEVSS